MRRRKMSALKPQSVIVILVVCGAVCLSGIGYVWAKTQVWGLSRKMKTLELALDELKRNNDALEREYAAMCTHARLEAKVKELGLGLSLPAPNQIVRLPEPVTMEERERQRQYHAARTNE